jgi:hypothetical protein
MTRRIAQLLASLAVATLPAGILAQATLQPTPPPAVTADNETWFLTGEPIIVSGNVYYPAGATVFFNRNEMVRTGHFRGIPLYSRPSLEPYAIIYVPLAGGLMQPYERRRSGDLAGTVGSTTPSFPVVSPVAQELTDFGLTGAVAQAAGPPTGIASLAGTETPVAVDRVPLGPMGTRSTTGTVSIRPVSPAPPRSARKPGAVNGVFVDYNGRRWFSSGPAVALNPAQFSRIGSYRGFPVYNEVGGTGNTIFVAVAESADALLAPYTARP